MIIFLPIWVFLVLGLELSFLDSIGMFDFLGTSIGKELLRSGVEYFMSLGLVNHAIVEQELNIQVQLTQVNVEWLFLKAFAGGEVVDFLFNEGLVLDELSADGLWDDVPPPENIGKFIDDFDKLLGFLYGVGDNVAVDFDIFGVGPGFVIVLADELDDRLEDEVLEESLVWVFWWRVLYPGDFLFGYLDRGGQVWGLNQTEILLDLEVGDFHGHFLL